MLLLVVLVFPYLCIFVCVAWECLSLSWLVGLPTHLFLLAFSTPASYLLIRPQYMNLALTPRLRQIVVPAKVVATSRATQYQYTVLITVLLVICANLFSPCVSGSSSPACLPACLPLLQCLLSLCHTAFLRPHHLVPNKDLECDPLPPVSAPESLH